MPLQKRIKNKFNFMQSVVSLTGIVNQCRLNSFTLSSDGQLLYSPHLNLIALLTVKNLHLFHPVMDILGRALLKRATLGNLCAASETIIYGTWCHYSQSKPDCLIICKRSSGLLKNENSPKSLKKPNNSDRNDVFVKNTPSPKSTRMMVLHPKSCDLASSHAWISFDLLPEIDAIQILSVTFMDNFFIVILDSASKVHLFKCCSCDNSVSPIPLETNPLHLEPIDSIQLDFYCHKISVFTDRMGFVHLLLFRSTGAIYHAILHLNQSKVAFDLKQILSADGVLSTGPIHLDSNDFLFISRFNRISIFDLSKLRPSTLNQGNLNNPCGLDNNGMTRDSLKSLRSDPSTLPFGGDDAPLSFPSNSIKLPSLSPIIALIDDPNNPNLLIALTISADSFSISKMAQITKCPFPIQIFHPNSSHLSSNADSDDENDSVANHSSTRCGGQVIMVTTSGPISIFLSINQPHLLSPNPTDSILTLSISSSDIKCNYFGQNEIHQPINEFLPTDNSTLPIPLKSAVEGGGTLQEYFVKSIFSKETRLKDFLASEPSIKCPICDGSLKLLARNASQPLSNCLGQNVCCTSGHIFPLCPILPNTLIQSLEDTRICHHCRLRASLKGASHTGGKCPACPALFLPVL